MSDALEQLAGEVGWRVVTMGSPFEETPEDFYWAERVRCDMVAALAALDPGTRELADKLDAEVDRVIFFGEGDARA